MRFSTLFLVLLIFSTQLFSQQTTGNLEGWVLGPQNNPLSDVNISIGGPAMQGSHGTASNTDGYFRLVSLPVGRYFIKISHVGYNELIFEDVTVHLGRTTTLGEVVLQTKTLEMEALVVSADRPVIDPTTTTNGLNLAYSQFESLPVDRDMYSIAALAPQVNTSFYGDPINISGGSGLENAYYIDGVNVTDPYIAGGGSTLPYNFIREVEVKSGGYEAEYGTALGGVVNVITHSGSNSFFANAFGFFTNNRLTGAREAGVIASNVEGFSSYDFGISLGGPLVKDKLWYFLAYNPQFEIEDIALPQLGTYQDKLETHIFAGKLSWQAAENTSITFNIFGDPSTHDMVGTPPFSVIPIPESNIENEDCMLNIAEAGGINYAINLRSMLAGNFMFESSIAHIRRRDNIFGVTERGRTEPMLADLVTGTYSGGTGINWYSRSARTAVDLKATWFIDRHTLKAGISYEDNSATEDITTIGPGSAGPQTIGGAGLILQLSDSLYESITGIWQSTVHNRIPSMFIQDAWQVTPRMLLQAGLRWSWEYLVNPEADIAHTISGEIQPRIGFVYQPGSLGTQKIYGSYGRFYEKIPAGYASVLLVDAQSYILTFDHNPMNDPVAQDSTRQIFILDDFDGQYIDEFTLGYETEIGDRNWIGVHGIHRYFGNVVEDAHAPGEEDVFIAGNPGQGMLSFVPERRRTYSALQISFRTAAFRDLNLYAAYTLSRLYGNYIGLYDHDANQASPNFTPNADFPDQEPNSTGLLPNDRTHVFKLWGNYRFDFGLNAGISFIWQSGSPLNNLGATEAGVPWYSFLQQRGTAGRMPALWDLSMRLTYDLDKIIPGNFQSKLILDLLHIGSPRKAVDFDQIHYFALDDDGNQTEENPGYLTPLQYQSPFTFRLGLEIGI